MFKTLPPPDTTEFAGKRAIVTGGSRGIGAAIVQRLLDGGATVITTARNATDETPKAATFIQGDISTLAGAQAFAAAALNELGGVDIVVNNAAAARAHLGASRLSPMRNGSTPSTSTISPPSGSNNALLPALREAGAGSVIVNISSSGAALTPAPPLAHYGAAKAARNAYRKALAAQLAPDEIRVTSDYARQRAHPGRRRDPPELRRRAGRLAHRHHGGHPSGRPGDPRHRRGRRLPRLGQGSVGSPEPA